MKKKVIQTFLRVFRAFSKVSAFSTKVENADMKANVNLHVRSPLSVCPRFPPNRLALARNRSIDLGIMTSQALMRTRNLGRDSHCPVTSIICLG